MPPLSRKKRIIYFIILFFVFVVAAPLFILDAKGYIFNLKDIFKISQAGGLYIGTDQSGLEIYINGELVKKTSIVQKSVFVEDLSPDIYQIEVSKVGRQTWYKTLPVFPEIVTEAKPFLLPKNPKLVEIPRYLNKEENVSTSTPQTFLKNPEYDSVNLLFGTTTLSKIVPKNKNATTSLDTKIVGDILVKNDLGSLHVFWSGDEDSTPSYFCQSSICKSEILVKTDFPVISFEFFPGRNDLLIIRLPTGIYVSEIDDRSVQNIQQIVGGEEYDFRVKDSNEIYIKKGISLYLVSL